MQFVLNRDVNPLFVVRSEQQCVRSSALIRKRHEVQLAVHRSGRILRLAAMCQLHTTHRARRLLIALPGKTAHMTKLPSLGRTGAVRVSITATFDHNKLYLALLQAADRVGRQDGARGQAAVLQVPGRRHLAAGPQRGPIQRGLEPQRRLGAHLFF